MEFVSKRSCRAVIAFYKFLHNYECDTSRRVIRAAGRPTCGEHCTTTAFRLAFCRTIEACITGSAQSGVRLFGSKQNCCWLKRCKSVRARHQISRIRCIAQKEQKAFAEQTTQSDRPTEAPNLDQSQTVEVRRVIQLGVRNKTPSALPDEQPNTV